MENVKDTDIDGYSTDQLLLLDLGKDIYKVFEFIQGLSVTQGHVSVPDPSYYRTLITEARGHASAIRQEVSKVLKAKTRAQTRLTSRNTRYQIQLEHKLENDATVLAGVSIEDRKARAANSLVALKNAINESKNEVEALKNLNKALDVTLRDFNAMCSDFREQSRLLIEELKHLPQLPPNGSDSKGISRFTESVESITERYNMSAETADIVDDTKVSGELTIGEDILAEAGSDDSTGDMDLVYSMFEGFKAATSFTSVSDNTTSLQAPDMTEGKSSPPDLATQTSGIVSAPTEKGYSSVGIEGFTLPDMEDDDDGGDTGGEAPPDTAPGSEEPDLWIVPSLEEEKDPGAGGNQVVETPVSVTTTEDPPLEVRGDSDDEILAEEGFDFIGLFEEDAISSEDLPTTDGTHSAGDIEFETVPLSMDVSPNGGNSVEATQDFGVESVSTTEPKVSKHFAEVPAVSSSGTEGPRPLEPKDNSVTEKLEASVPSGIDDLLDELLGGS